MRLTFRLTALALTAVLASCGGGGSNVSAVKVAGDSLADAGTFGFKFTVQGASLTQTRIWADHVADAADVAPLCPRYAATGPNTVAPNPSATGCTSYAVGGARINVAGSAGDATPFSVLQQLRDLGTQPYAEQDVLLVDGGGNDAADLIGAYLGANTDGGAAYVALLGELLSSAQVAPASGGGAQGAAVAEQIAT